MKRVTVRQRANGQVLLTGAEWGDSFFSRLRGMMFRSSLAEGEALILVEARDSRATASIHMFFMAFPIAAVWVNGAGRVVDKALAQPWQPYYAPREPARYTIETHPAFLERVAVGDEVDFE